jgi:hypothetical protein
LQDDHGLDLAAEGEFLFRGQQLMATDLAQKGTQGTRHGGVKLSLEPRGDPLYRKNQPKGFRVYFLIAFQCNFLIASRGGSAGKSNKTFPFRIQ